MEDTTVRFDEKALDRQDDDLTRKERIQWYITRALENAESTDTKAHLRQALAECQDLPPTPLIECPLCGKVGLPERISAHECGSTSTP